MSTLIRSKLSAVRRKRVSLCIARTIGWAIAWVIVAVAVSMLLDWWLDLSVLWRLVALGINAAGLLAIVALVGIIPIVTGPDEDELALWVERETPSLSSRLISVIQLTRLADASGQSHSLVGALIKSTEQMTAEMDFTSVVKFDALFKELAGVVGIVLAAMLSFALARPDSVDLLKRSVFLSDLPVPRKTKIDWLQQDLVVPRGEALTISARTRGIIPSIGSAILGFQGGQSQRMELLPRADDKSIFDLNLSSVQESFSVVFELGDNRSSAIKVRSEPRPAVNAVQCTQYFPDYTHLPPLKRAAGDLSLLAGSRLQISVKASKPLKYTPIDDVHGNRVKLVGVDSSFGLLANINDTSQLETRDNNQPHIPLPAGTTGFSIQLVDTNNISSKDSAVYRIDLLADKAPTVRVIQPTRKEELATRRAVVPISFEAADDFALAQVQLNYKLDDVEQKPVDLDIGPPGRQLRGTHQFDLNQLSLKDGQSLEWWLVARDGNNITGPGVGASEHFVVRIVSDDEKRSELMNRLNDSMSQMNDVAESQKQLNSDLGKIITEKKVEP